MLTLTAGLAAVSSDLFLYFTRDPLLENLPVVIFYGPATTGNTTQNSSRIQSHVFSLAGFLSFPRLTVSPTSPLYAAVNHLPSDCQGDEVSRGLAVSLLSYFAALSKETKSSLRSLAGSRRPNGVAPMMFDEMHAGELAAKMEQIEASGPILEYLNTAVVQQSMSWLDIDVMLPFGSMKRVKSIEDDQESEAFDENGLPLLDYGQYNYLIRQLGSPAFLPTSKLKRAFSKPTPHHRSRTLSKDAKINLRRELCELVDTENTYLTKLSELVNQIATSFRHQHEIKDVETLFPQSLDHILNLSEGFYDEIQSVLDATEDEAIRDIESLSTSGLETGSDGAPNEERDATGATTFSRTLLAWFPKFLKPYQDYLRASTHFSQFLGEIAKDPSSKFSLKLSSIGEQHLRSALIEPVQRLPRYSLLIDNMVNLLPLSHPALSNLSKARDNLNQICTLDTITASEGSTLSKTMGTIVQDWPASLLPAGRLIAAIDVVELDPPYDPGKTGNPGVILLFQDRLVLLDKLSDGALSARGVLAEVDRPAMQAHIDRYLETQSEEKTLGLSEIFDLSRIRITQSKDGHLIHLTDLATALPKIHSTTHFKVFCLQGSYENKAARLGEEIAKARIEGRYPEAVRDSGKWALRSLAHPQQVGLLLALSETYQLPSGNGHKAHGRIILFVGDGTPDDVRSEATIKANIKVSEANMCHLSIEAPFTNSSKVECSIEDVAPALVKRLGEVLRKEYEQDIDGQTSYYRVVLHSLPLNERQGETKHHNYRPISPIKLLSKVFSGDVGISKSPIKLGRNVPSIPPTATLSSSSKETTNFDINFDTQDAKGKVTLLDSDNAIFKSPLSLLEDTFLAYIVALRSRCGNVIGKILRNRAAADELAINELYNTLLEDPSRLHMAAQAPIDVLFAAFEKFLRAAWRERMGPLVSPMAIQKLQSSLEVQRPTLFAQDFKSFLDEMPPQSRRCFATMIKLLLELLEGSGNDGDRGVLIVSFAEALVLVGNPHDYIHLLDRLVDDYDHLFEDAVDKPASSGSATGSVAGSRSVNTGSVGSNASSLRRKFGFGGGLNRENSKNESESKVASIWRTMSKNAKSPGDAHSQTNIRPEVTPKGSMVRSRSTDTASKMLTFRRPESRDRPPTAGSGVSNENQSRPGSAHNTFSALRNIGEGMTIDASILKRKKQRRSSLSDLFDIKDGSPLPVLTPLQPREIPPRASSTKTKTLPRTPSPRKASRGNRAKPSPPRSAVPNRPTYLRGRENSPFAAATKENLPPSHATPPKINPGESLRDHTFALSSPTKRNTSRSNVSAPKAGGLSERMWPPNDNNTPPKKTTADGSPRKLRIQSPQKLRERMSQEQKSVAGEQIDLQMEIDQIGQELSIFKLRPRTTHSASTTPSLQQQTVDHLSSRLDHLSTRLTTFTTGHTATTHLLHTDLDSSLHIAEKKARQLDELYREANAENEALYDRFNAELEKVLGRVRKGDGVDEIKERLAESLKEAAGLRAEKAKLVRELAGLRSLVQD